jgi:16S rRNA (cytosine1402-N4)-methyltransferase
VEFQHRPVLLAETLALLRCRPGSIIVDCTLGGAGHASAIAERVRPGGRLIGFDQDGAAIAAAGAKLAAFGDTVTLVRANFAALTANLAEIGVTAVDGVLFDLGVSSYQLDARERGFTYQQNAPLDMRMDTRAVVSAREIVNELPEAELSRIIAEYGEERWAKRIASFIAAARKRGTIATTGQLVEIIKQAIPAAARREGPHPARRTFQALRIAVNDELGVLEKALRQAVEVLRPGGRLCAISFHSLEDRIVKRIYREYASGCTCPPQLPVCVCGKQKTLKIITRRPVIPAAAEQKINPRSRSAKLRAAEKTTASSRESEVGIK